MELPPSARAMQGEAYSTFNQTGGAVRKEGLRGMAGTSCAV
jgi:hypothetical protein